MCGIYNRFDSKIRFEIESDGRFDSGFDLNAKKRFAGPYFLCSSAVLFNSFTTYFFSHSLSSASL